ncbi:MAG: endonuclease/exonuclease/phosphatase family protein [Thermoguttaceae bacterium]|nr:endonuclease/exonuclease/phosphatase family protein [Thermoguttaceae bacterium]
MKITRRDYLKSLAVALVGSSTAATFGDEIARKEQPKEDALHLKILSYNIQIGRAPGGSYSNPAEAFLDRTAEVIKNSAPDIAGLQEVDKNTERSGIDVDQLGELSRLTDLYPTFSPKRELPGGLYGVGVLSKERPITVETVIMEGSAHPRALQMLEFEKYYFFNTHLPLTAPLRQKAVQTIDSEAAKRTDKPIILVGDLNAEPTSEEIQTLRKTWTQVSPEAPTFPAPEPTVQIDYVFVRNAAKIDVVKSEVVPDRSTSDHRPVFCELTIQ